jgi:hypothetical protein
LLNFTFRNNIHFYQNSQKCYFTFKKWTIRQRLDKHAQGVPMGGNRPGQPELARLVFFWRKPGDAGEDKLRAQTRPAACSGGAQSGEWVKPRRRR